MTRWAKKMVFTPALVLICLGAVAAWGASSASQTQPGQQAVQRPLGSITAIQGNTITLKTDAGAQVSVQVQDSTKMVRVEPGQKTLQGATPVRLQDLQVGDRILVRGAGDPNSVAASSIILMKHADIQQKQQQEQEAWQRGVGGLVKTVDPAAGAITLSTGAGPTAKTVTVHTSKDTIVRRYAAASVKFSDAAAGTLDQIKPGDQLRARGTKNADGTELTADEIVSGSFRNIAGTVVSVDSAANEVTVTDLITKKPVVVKVTADSQMRKLPAMMAQMIAMRLKGGMPGAAPGAATGAAASHGGTGAPPGGAPPGQGQWAHGGAGGGAGQGPGGAGGGAGGWRSGGGTPDFQQMLNRMPAATLADLQKGNAVMIVSSAGAESVTALTLLSGVEPILTASPGGNQSAAAAMMSGWTLGGGGAGGGEAGGDAGQGPG
ncbi:MAG TPA: DUF5666 domain-containing protein [Terriglobia bacterium]|nr:DUF5666 domain-containing protein [Terriglobia bacterium]